MLAQSFKERVHELVQLAFEDCRTQARDDFSKMSADYALRGFNQPIHTIMIAHAVALKQVDVRVSTVWEAMQRVLISQDIAYSTGLAGELQEFHAFYCPLSLWDLPTLYQAVGKELDETQRNDLLAQRDRGMSRVRAEINLFVDRLRSKAQAPTSLQQMELDQKSGILLSPAQAPRDFANWQKELLDAPMGVLFLDFDRFKDLNTRHTETTVDRTILPEAMRLLRKLTHLRGGCYRQGGDEFLVILPNHNASESVAFGEILRSTLAAKDFLVGSVTERITLSVGVACWPDHGETFEEVLQKANDAKQVAKSRRNCVVLAVTERKPFPIMMCTNVPVMTQFIRRYVTQLIGSSYDVTFSEVATAEDVRRLANSQPVDMFILVLNNVMVRGLGHRPGERAGVVKQLVSDLAREYGKPIIALSSDDIFRFQELEGPGIVFLKIPFDSEAFAGAVRTVLRTSS